MTFKRLFFVFFLFPIFLHTQNEEIHVLNLPCVPFFSIGCPDAAITEDGLYQEYIGEGDLKVQFELVEGKREGEVVILNEAGDIFAKGIFHNNKLQDNQLTVFNGGETIELSLDHDPPLWFFSKHVLCQSGVNQIKDGVSYVWLAGQRFRLEEGVEFALR